MLSKYISIPIFLMSFAVGLFCVYAIGPEIKTIYVYPNPTNFDKMQYKDRNDQCFQYEPVEVKCPINPFSIKTIPVQ